MWNMQVTIIPIVISAFGTVTKGLLKGLEDLEVCGRVESIQTTAFIILKSRLTLQVIQPARASIVTPSLIDDSARP